MLNPLVHIIEATRTVLVRGPPSTFYLLTGLPLSLGFCELSFRLFQKARRGFADVI